MRVIGVTRVTCAVDQRCLQVDMASMEEVDEIARTPNHIPISCHMR